MWIWHEHLLKLQKQQYSPPLQHLKGFFWTKSVEPWVAGVGRGGVTAGAMGHGPSPKAEGRMAGGPCPFKEHFRRSNSDVCSPDYSAGHWGGEGESGKIFHTVLPADQLRSESQLHVLKWCLWCKIHRERSEMVVTNTSETDMKGEPDSNWWLQFDLFDFSCVISIISLGSFESRNIVGCKNLLQTFIVRMVIEF